MNFDTQGPPGAVGTVAPTAPEQDAVPVQPQPQQPPQTGDADLDDAMQDLARAQSRSFGERIESGERVHRLLQGRLSDLGRA